MFMYSLGICLCMFTDYTRLQLESEQNACDFHQGHRTLMLFVSQRIGRHASYDLFRKDATVSTSLFLFSIYTLKCHWTSSQIFMGK